MIQQQTFLHLLPIYCCVKYIILDIDCTVNWKIDLFIVSFDRDLVTSTSQTLDT